MNAQTAQTLLEAKLSDLVARHGKLDAHLKNQDRMPPADSQERAQFLENDEVLEALDDNTRDEIGQLKGALRRIAQGTWGTCVGCGEPIGDKRLAALPWTARCIGCAD